MTITQQVLLYEVIDEGNGKELREMKAFMHKIADDAAEAFSDQEAQKLMQVISSMPTKHQLMTEENLAEGDVNLLGKPENPEEQRRWEKALKDGMYKVTRRGEANAVYEGEGLKKFNSQQESNSSAEPSSTAEQNNSAASAAPMIDQKVLEERQEKSQRLGVIESELDSLLNRKQQIDEEIQRLQTESKTIEDGMAALAQEAKALRDDLASSDQAVEQARKTLMEGMQMLQQQMHIMQQQAQLLGLSI